jgi:serine/threonine protein kinase
LLGEEHAVGDFLNSRAIPSLGTPTPGASSPSDRHLPATIGHYRILYFIGEGGMAVVYKAEQQEPRWIVALKVIKPVSSAKIRSRSPQTNGISEPFDKSL